MTSNALGEMSGATYPKGEMLGEMSGELSRGNARIPSGVASCVLTRNMSSGTQMTLNSQCREVNTRFKDVLYWITC